jgi:hypothetical protein
MAAAEAERAAVLLGAARAYGAATAQPLHQAERQDVDEAEAGIGSTLNSETLAAALARGHDLSFAEARAFAHR